MTPNQILARRYAAVIAERHPDPHKGNPQMDHAHITWMCEQIIERDADWPIDKTGRWLGFVQGILTAQGLLDVEVEREFSRPLFHQLYARNGVPIPSSIYRVVQA